MRPSRWYRWAVLMFSPNLNFSASDSFCPLARSQTYPDDRCFAAECTGPGTGRGVSGESREDGKLKPSTTRYTIHCSKPFCAAQSRGRTISALLRREARARIVARREQPLGEGLRVHEGLPRPEVGRRMVTKCRACDQHRAATTAATLLQPLANQSLENARKCDEPRRGP